MYLVEKSWSIFSQNSKVSSMILKSIFWNFGIFAIQHDSKIRDTGNRFKINSGFSCNFGCHKSECFCLHEISIFSEFYFRSQKFSVHKILGVVSSLKVISRLKRTDSSCPSENICNLIPPRVTS